MYNELTCLFGHHQYSDTPTRDKRGRSIYFCTICRRNGYDLDGGVTKVWFDFDEDGNVIHLKRGDGLEAWYHYDDKGNMIHRKWSDGWEVWKDNSGGWVSVKPKNWKQEKCITN